MCPSSPAPVIVGPCALEYTKMKTADHFWTDPSADELVQRHRIHSGYCRQDSPTKRPALCVSNESGGACANVLGFKWIFDSLYLSKQNKQNITINIYIVFIACLISSILPCHSFEFFTFQIQKRHSSSSMDERPSPSPSARDYVESLHQNNRATLLFGKNNVLVQPVSVEWRNSIDEQHKPSQVLLILEGLLLTCTALHKCKLQPPKNTNNNVSLISPWQCHSVIIIYLEKNIWTRSNV